jgi:hypothetical protein
MACAIEIAEPVRTRPRTNSSAPKLNLSELRDLLDSLENQGLDEESRREIVQAHFSACRD